MATLSRHSCWKKLHSFLQVFGVTNYISVPIQSLILPKKRTTPSLWLDTLSTCEMSPESARFDCSWWAWNEADITDAVIFQSFFRQVKHVKLYLCLSFGPVKYSLYGVQPPCRQDVEEKGKEPGEVKQIKTLFTVAQQYPETAITLKW